MKKETMLGQELQAEYNRKRAEVKAVKARKELSRLYQEGEAMVREKKLTVKMKNRIASLLINEMRNVASLGL